MSKENATAILNIWKETEIKLRKDKVGRELFRELLKRVYIRLENE